GGLWLFLENGRLNANGFQENLAGIARPPLHQTIPGASAGGPIVRERLFVFTSVEHQRFRSQSDPVSMLMPTRSFVASLDPSSPAGRLLSPFTAMLPPDPSASAQAVFDPPASFNQTSGVMRTDYVSK